MIITQDQLFAHLGRVGLIKSRGAEHQRDPKNDNLPAVITSNPDAQPVQSVMLNPQNRLFRGGKNIVEPNRKITYRVLRTVAEKGFLINTIINHVCNQVRPYLKASTDKNVRGFQIRLSDQEAQATEKDKKNIKALEKFFLHTGFDTDPEREDDLVKYTMKLVRDALTLDQITTELQQKNNGRTHAFWAVDPATIFRVSELGYDGDDKIKFIQEIDSIPVAYYTHKQMVFDYRNPRSDIEHFGYGYSETEQAIDLITSMINSFMFNAGFFTENRIPRGMLLLNQDADMETVEAMEDYIVGVMSGGPGSQWRVPIIPAGYRKGEGSGKAIEWVSLQQTNRDMEYSQWQEFLWSSVAALYGIDLEEIGIKTSKSASLIGANTAPRIEESKSRGLSNILSFLQSYFNRILNRVDPNDRYDFEFVGYEKDDVKLKNETRESRLRTTMSIDELRAEEDLEPYNEDWSKIPLNPQVVQMVMADKQNQMMQQQGGMMGGMGGEEGGGEPQEGGDFTGGPEEQDYREMMFSGDDDGQGAKPRKSIYDDEGEEGGDQDESRDQKPKNPKYKMQKAIEIVV